MRLSAILFLIATALWTAAVWISCGAGSALGLSGCCLAALAFWRAVMVSEDYSR